MSSGRITLDSLPPISARRRNTDRAMRWLMWVAVGIALVPLVLIIYYLIHKGAGQWTGSFFSSDPNGNFFGNHGGIRSAILGTLELIGIASLIAIPIGIAVALYLTEYGKNSRMANVVRYFVDVMTGVPSIVFGLFIYITLVISHVGGSSFAGWKGAVAVTLLMLPIVVRSAEVVLLLVPSSLREAALALGAPRWRVITRVVLPTSLSGLVTGSLLAVARGMGETAPLLFTVSYTMNLTGNPNTLMNSLPVQIYNDIHSPESAVQARAWGGALTLVALVLIINLIARAVSRRSRMT
jgi:phosphate transport system permease protein